MTDPTGVAAEITRMWADLEEIKKAVWRVKPLEGYPIKPEEAAAFNYGKDCAYDRLCGLLLDMKARQSLTDRDGEG